MHTSNMDLNLLNIAAALYKSRNVSKAAADLGLSQSAVSHALARLRDHFEDPMFVRTSKGIAPTEFARHMQSEILELVERAKILASRKTSFDPMLAKGRITLSTQDYFECTIGPKLQTVLAKEAPGVQLSIRPTLGDLPKGELESGKVDFAIAGFYKDLPEGFFQTKLFSDTFTSAVSESHPTIKSKLTIDEYFDARHALITLQGDFRDNMSHRVGKIKRQRDIVYGSYSFTGLAWVLESSDLILTAPDLLLRQYKKFTRIRIFPCPVELGSIDVRMIWHSQTNEDPLRIWFRKKLKEICSKT